MESRKRRQNITGSGGGGGTAARHGTSTNSKAATANVGGAKDNIGTKLQQPPSHQRVDSLKRKLGGGIIEYSSRELQEQSLEQVKRVLIYFTRNVINHVSDIVYWFL